MEKSIHWECTVFGAPRHAALSAKAESPCRNRLSGKGIWLISGVNYEILTERQLPNADHTPLL